MFTKRFKAAWLVVLTLLALAAPQPGFAAQSASPQDAAAKALAWMQTQQQPDGSFAGFGVGSTVDALLAIEAAGQDPASYSKGGKTPIDFLAGKTTDLAKTPGSAGKALLAVAVLKEPFAGRQALLDGIGANLPPDAHYGKDTIGHAFAMLGLTALGMAVPPKAAQYLQSVQGPDGGWSFSGDTKPGSSDTNTTAVAVQALIAAGVPATDPSLQKALGYLNSQANDDGGFPYQKGSEQGGESDVNSTAYVVQALQALHADVSKPMAFLLSMQKADGAFQWTKSQPDDNAGATYQAVPAILGVTLIPSVPQVQTPTEGSGTGSATTPGMPTTGDPPGLPLPVAALVALGAMALCSGFVLRIRPNTK